VRRPAPALLTTTALAALLGAGCGADRVKTPDVSRPFSTGGLAQRAYPAAGVTFQAPADWPFDPGKAPLVASTSSGSATIAVWRYPRTEPLPRGEAALTAAEDALQQAAQARDETFRVQQVRRVRIDGARAIQLVGTERVGSTERQVRSTHVYAKGAEFVIDAYAAPRDFAPFDQAVFQPLLRTVKIDPPRA
jgi:hypothetical protein